MYIYEAKLTEDEDGLYLTFPDFPGAIADGDDLAEVVEAAAETLKLFVAEYVDNGDPLPEPAYSFAAEPGSVAIAVDVDEDYIQRTKCLTQKEAAEELGVSLGRISHMIDSGILQAVRFGNDRLVTIASVNKRKAAPKKAGRPRKQAD